MKLHPLSAPLRAATDLEVGQVVILGGGGAVVGGQGSGTGGGVVTALAIVLVLFAVRLGRELLYVRRFEYVLTDDSLDVDSGVLSRRERSIPLRRIQNVDITRDPLARLTGLAAVAFETAGGGDDAEGEIRYVTATEADRLRNEIQRLKGSSRGNGSIEATDSAGETGAEAAGESEELFALSTRDLLVASALSLDLRPLLPVALLVFEGTQYLPSGLAAAVVGRPGVGAVVAAVGSVLAGVAVTFARFYGFRLWRSGDELRYERGLVSRYTGSIPFEKVQSLVVTENVLARRFGYAALDVETAGYGSQSAAAQGSESVVPFADREAVLRFARSIDGFAFDPPRFSRPPKRARRRYAGRYAIAVLLTVAGLFVANRLFDVDVLQWWFVPLALLVVVPFAAHYAWVHRGVATDEGFVLTRNGFWRRTTEVVPYYRVQTVNEDRTLFQRRWGLATVVVDTAGSRSLGRDGARAVDFDRDEADDLLELVRQRLRRSVIERRRERVAGAGGS